MTIKPNIFVFWKDLQLIIFPFEINFIKYPLHAVCFCKICKLHLEKIQFFPGLALDEILSKSSNVRLKINET